MSLSYARNASKILCIGRNYVDHIKELNNVAPSQPFFFLKPRSAILLPGEGPVLRPKGSNLHYEVELAVVIGKQLRNVEEASFSEKECKDAISGYAVAVDLTARDLQDEAKKKGLPWSIAKGFDTFLPLSGFIPKASIPNHNNVTLQLSVNGSLRQNDNTGLMIFKIPRMLSHISKIMTLEPGDIVLTGTPKGVGSLNSGDKVSCRALVDQTEINESKIEFEIQDK